MSKEKVIALVVFAILAEDKERGISGVFVTELYKDEDYTRQVAKMMDEIAEEQGFYGEVKSGSLVFVHRKAKTIDEAKADIDDDTKAVFSGLSHALLEAIRDGKVNEFGGRLGMPVNKGVFHSESQTLEVEEDYKLTSTKGVEA